MREMISKIAKKKICRKILGYFFGLIFISCLSVISNAIESASVGTLEAIIINEESSVFEKPDFDSEIFAELEAGLVLKISKNPVSGTPFHKVKLPDGSFGYIPDTDFQFKNAEANKANKINRTNKNELNKKNKKKDSSLNLKNSDFEDSSLANLKNKAGLKSMKSKPLDLTKFRGASFSWINYREETMGLVPASPGWFIGAQFVGPDMIFEGNSIELNIMLRPSAPDYYQQATGQSAGGFVMNVNYLYETTFPQTRNESLFFGFGPMFRFSQIEATLKNPTTGQLEYYSLGDMVLGALFNLGVHWKFGSLGLRVDYKYFWEKAMYGGLSISTLFEF